METKTMSMIIACVILAFISRSNGDTCYCNCCVGNFCTPTLQGTISVPSCASSSCESLCKAAYPSKCTDGPGSGIYQCKSGGETYPNWPGIYNTEHKCDTTTCCCPGGQMILSKVSTNVLRVQLGFIGNCGGATHLDDEIPMPTVYSIQVSVLGNPIQVTLSQDARTIQLINPIFPMCSETATRDDPFSTTTSSLSTATINLTSLVLLSVLLSIRQFII